MLMGYVWLLAGLISGQILNEPIMMQDDLLIAAVEKNNTREVASALQKGADVNTVDKQKRNLLLVATQKKLPDMAKLLVQYGADVNQQDDRMDSPFLYAGATGQTDLLKLFLAHGARFDVFNRYYGTALIPACERGHIETVQLLVNTPGFPVDHVNRLGWTALMEAVVLGDGSKTYVDIVRILVAAGCNTTIPDKNGATALQHARNAGYKEIAAILSRK